MKKSSGHLELNEDFLDIGEIGFMNRYDVGAGRQWLRRAHVKNGIGKL